MAQNPLNRHDPMLSYRDFRPDRARHLTVVDDRTYRRTCSEISPWSVIPGWKLPTALHDIMHVVFLGTARDLKPSLLAEFVDHGCLGDDATTLNYRLRAFSIEMHKAFRAEGNLFCVMLNGVHMRHGRLIKLNCVYLAIHLRISVRKILFTVRNTGLDNRGASFPALATAFKASHIKMTILWYLRQRSVEFATETEVPSLQLFFACQVVNGACVNEII